MKSTMQCDRCGGEMRLSEDGLRAKCPYCNHEIVFRSPKGEALLLALARADSFRRDSRFSDAIREYKLITEENPEDSEAFWGLVLSTYGIEYVKDPRTSRYVPTCHRAVRGSILEDENYLHAIGSATEEQRADYTVQANEIDRLQKDILRRTESAEDFDVFISFKSTDESGNSTEDARIARNIYDELTKRGFKTFFSDVTLNDMLFSDYEPVIFRALYSCKFFILVATRPEYVTAPWVTNEWSRFEQRMEEEKLSGVACAVFDGKAVHDLPPFLRAQGIDLNRHSAGGYEVLLADSIERKLGRSAKSRSDEEFKKQLEEQKKQQAAIEERLSSIGGASTSVDSLLMRAEQELEMEKKEEAHAYYTRVLDIRPSCGEAWWGLFLMDMQVRSESEILGNLTPEKPGIIRANKNYINAVRYATDKCAERIEAFNRELFNGERWWKLFLREMSAETEDEIVGKLDVPVLKAIRNSEYLKTAEEFADDALKEKLFAFRKSIYLRLKEDIYPAEKSSHEEFQRQWDERADEVKKQAEQKVKKSQELQKILQTLNAEKDTVAAELNRLKPKAELRVFTWGFGLLGW